MGIAGYGDFGDTIDDIGDLPVSYLLVGLGLALANYLLRYLRWSYYLSVLKIHAPVGLSM